MMADTRRRPSPSDRREAADAARLSYDAGVGILTVTLGAAEQLADDEIVDGIFTFYDILRPGRMVKLQALVPDGVEDTWRMVLADCLAPTLGRRCLELIDADESVSLEEVVIPKQEWAALRYMQWPALHQAIRSSYGMPTADMDDALHSGRVPRWTGSLLVPASPSSEPGRSVIRVPTALAAACEIEDIEVTLSGRTAHVRAAAHWKSDDAPLAVAVLSPDPRSAEPVVFRKRGHVATADVELRESVDLDMPPRVLLHLAATGTTHAPVLRSFVCHVRDQRGVSELVGVRARAWGGVAYSGVQIGRTADRIYWRNPGKPAVEVTVLRQGKTLWVRGFAKRTRRTTPVRVSCVLRPEAVEVLKPDGNTGPEAGRLEAKGTVEQDGFFQLKLASVSTSSFHGELVERLELHIG